MILSVYILTLVYFAIGAIAIALINHKRKDPAQNRERWTKYILYLVIVNAVVASIIAWIFHIIAFAIVIVGVYEIALASSSRKTPWQILAAMLVFTLLSICFIRFSLVTETSEQLFVYMLVFIFDGFSQITGQLIGRHKFVPNISPEKTLEGSIGGLLISLLTAILLKEYLFLLTSEALALAFAVCIFAFGGDLLASYYKRVCRIKDYSQLIPGHGGMLDRFDSFIAAGALYWIITLF